MASEVIRKRWCKECGKETMHEVIVDVSIVKTCLECGFEEVSIEEKMVCQQS